MTERPTGTVTFLFTDIEQSTRRWEERPDLMRPALAQHDQVLREAVVSHEGWLFKHLGDGVIAAFSSAQGAIEAAIAAQRRLELPVRMGVCTGEAELRDNDYFGPTLNRASRIMTAAHAGQILVAASSAASTTGIVLRDLGEYRFRDLTKPERLFQVQADGLAKDFPAPRTASVVSGNLPVPSTRLLGREKDLSTIGEQLRTSRLLTLSGVGGVGKTRLAIQAATEAMSAYPDGAWLIEFAAVGDPAAVGFAVAGILGVAQQPGRTIEQSLVESLRQRRLLLVFDNCEHLIGPIAALAGDILSACPGITLLATSREALAIDGEQTWPVPSLSFRDGAGSPAVQLFLERARAVLPGFELASHGESIGEICRRLDGIPLAIELAAARIRSMSPDQIRDRLDERFRLLTGGSRRALERHQTLRHAVQWSYGLLTTTEQAVLNGVSVFAGGFSLKAAERVCADKAVDDVDVLDALDSLVRKSLVTVERTDGAVRYALLETIRQFAEEQLGKEGEIEPTRDRHARFFADDADRMFIVWRSPKQRAAYDWLDQEIGNLRVAFRWSIDRNEPDSAIRIVAGIGDMARFHLRDEATYWASEVLATARQTQHRCLIITLTWASSFAWSLSRLEEAKHFGEEALALVGDDKFVPLVWAHIDLALVALYEGDLARAIDTIRAGAAHPEDRHDRMCAAILPFFLSLGGFGDEARRAAISGLASAEATGIPLSLCNALLARGRAFSENDPLEALASYERCILVARESGNGFFEALAIPEIAALRARSGDVVAALQVFRDMTELWKRSSDQVFLATGLGGLIVLLGRIGELTTAATLHGALAKILPANTIVPQLSETIDRIRNDLGNETVDHARQRGAAMSVQDMIASSVTEIDRAIGLVTDRSKPRSA